MKKTSTHQDHNELAIRESHKPEQYNYKNENLKEENCNGYVYQVSPICE